MIITNTKVRKFVEGNIKDALKPEVGDTIRIIDMMGEPQYTGKTGVITHIDDAGQIHGTWGGCAIIPEEDSYELIKEEEK